VINIFQKLTPSVDPTLSEIKALPATVICFEKALSSIFPPLLFDTI
jgi:hypothetical protein